MTPEDRAWEVVRRAFEERAPSPRRTVSPWAAVVAVAVAVLAVAVASPPGRAVLGGLRDSVGAEPAAPALFSLPAPGRLLVVSAEGGGVWVASADGSRRRLGDYDDASWSPFGRFVVATRADELVALEPNGDERWSLARRGVAFPRWGGSRTDTRIAYCSASGLRVVAGDGTGDRLLDPRACESAWRPGARHVLTYLAGGTVVTEDVDARRVLWHGEGGASLAWSSRGDRLAVVSPHRVRVLDRGGRPLRTLTLRRRVVSAAFRPGSAALALHLRAGGGERATSEVRLYGADGTSRRLFAASGVFGDVAWSPDGRWLLVDWPSGGQWVFVAPSGRVRAVTNLARQFPRPDEAYPTFRLAGRWCCGE